MITVNKLRCLCGIAADDATRDTVLSEMLDLAISFASAYTGVEYTDAGDDLSTLETAVIKMVTEDFGRLGSGGVSYKSYSNVNESYRARYSDDVYTLLGRARRLSVLSGGGADGA